jgi:hypothetical protein
MYRIELASGEETVFRTIEELATAIRNGVVNTRARIYHNASQKWLPIEFHPHYKKALEIPAAPAHPADSGPLRAPDFRSSGPQPALAPAQAAPVQHQPTPVQHQPTPVQHYPTPAQHHPSPVEHHPTPVQHHPTPVQHHPTLIQHLAAPVHPHRVPAEPYRAPAPHHPAPVQHHRAMEQPHSAPVPIPPPVPSPVLQLTRPRFTPPSTQPSFGAATAALALEEPPMPEPVVDEPPPSIAKPSGSWIRGPIKLGVIGVIAIVCTRVVVSAAAPGSETRPLAETAPRPAPASRKPVSESAVSAEQPPGVVLTAGPAFSPAIVTSAQAAKAPAPAPAPAPASRPAPAAASTDSIASVDAVPTTVDLALPDVPRTDSLSAPTRSDSGAIRRILRAVTSSKPAPINAPQ